MSAQSETPFSIPDDIPEYFAKPGVVEGLLHHPVALIRQMATEMLRMRQLSAQGAGLYLEAIEFLCRRLEENGLYSPALQPVVTKALAALRAAQAAPSSPAAKGWQPIETAPKDKSVLLATANSHVPIYCGRQRYGNLGEPQQDVFAWRCDSSGRFSSPTHWMPLPDAPVLIVEDKR